MNEKEIKKQAQELFEHYKKDPEKAVLMLSAVIQEAASTKERTLKKVKNLLIPVIEALRIPDGIDLPKNILILHKSMIDDVINTLKEF